MPTNLKFLRGPQSNLNTIIDKSNGTLTIANYNDYMGLTGANALEGESALNAALNAIPAPVEGAFYLTDDTYRLYTGVNKGTTQNPNVKLVELNQSVTQVANVNSLPDVNTVDLGQFYYTIAENILCTCISKTINNQGQSITVKDWQQINPDTRIDSAQFGIEDTIAIAQSGAEQVITENQDWQDTNDNGVLITSTLQKNRSDYGTNHTISSGFELIAGTNVVLKTNKKHHQNRVNDAWVTDASYPQILIDVPVYNKAEIDTMFKDRLQSFNALDYVGSIDATLFRLLSGETIGGVSLDTPPTRSEHESSESAYTVKDGDVFVVSEGFKIYTGYAEEIEDPEHPGEMIPDTDSERLYDEYVPGDLLIATGTENTQGYVIQSAYEIYTPATDTSSEDVHQVHAFIAADFQWVKVPGGNDIVSIDSLNGTAQSTFSTDYGTEYNYDSNNCYGYKLSLGDRDFAYIRSESDSNNITVSTQKVYANNLEDGYNVKIPGWKTSFDLVWDTF